MSYFPQTYNYQTRKKSSPWYHKLILFRKWKNSLKNLINVLIQNKKNLSTHKMWLVNLQNWFFPFLIELFVIFYSFLFNHSSNHTLRISIWLEATFILMVNVWKCMKIFYKYLENILIILNFETWITHKVNIKNRKLYIFLKHIWRWVKIF